MDKMTQDVVIIAHRGYWKNENEKNKKAAFERAFDCGFGVETDLRDIKGEIVISHNMPLGDEISFELRQIMKIVIPVIKRINATAPHMIPTSASTERFGEFDDSVESSI